MNHTMKQTVEIIFSTRPLIVLQSNELKEFLEISKANLNALLNDHRVPPVDKVILETIMQEAIRAAELEKILRN
jgi:DNA-binding Xre family transcriptional regulator